MAEESEDSPPASSDLEGWRRAVARGQLGSFRPEALLCAVQDLGPDADPRVLNPIAKHLSDIVMKMARGYIGTNKPNKGVDIITGGYLRADPRQGTPSRNSIATMPTAWFVGWPRR
jgi:hypothetical protein